ncbi:MAG: hypothetical protein EOP00_19530 [Pedobacter sp.]|nr:MAG: hypothetical protein EOP00_19530 [Pedobacter sp.]
MEKNKRYVTWCLLICWQLNKSSSFYFAISSSFGRRNSIELLSLSSTSVIHCGFGSGLETMNPSTAASRARCASFFIEICLLTNILIDRNKIKISSTVAKLLYIFSPNILSILGLIIFMIYCVVDTELSQGWSLTGIIIAIPVLGVCLITDLLFR